MKIGFAISWGAPHLHLTLLTAVTPLKFWISWGLVLSHHVFELCFLILGRNLLNFLQSKLKVTIFLEISGSWGQISGNHLFKLCSLILDDCESFARRTFTTPKIRTFTTPKFGHLPPPQKKHLPGGQLPTPIFFFFFWRIFLGIFHLQLMEDNKDGKEEVLHEEVMEHIK